MDNRLTGKAAIITGAARGIGKATATLFARQGAKVSIWDIIPEGEQTAQELREQGYTVEFRKVDVADPAEVSQAVHAVVQQFGRIDILINNAGITRDITFLKMTREDWDKVLKINIEGVFNCTKAVVPHMVEQQYGRIINTSSIVAQVGNFGQTNYSASKAALIGFTKSLAKELGKHRITVNAVAPGFVQTEMTDAIPEHLRMMAIATIPLGRPGQPEDIAYAYLYLASDEASFVSGHVLGVNGGVA